MDTTYSSVIAKLTPLITQKESLKRLLRSQGRDAQELLDLFQWLLDQPGLDEQLRKHVIVSTQRISAKTGLYPVCHELKNGIEHAKQAGAGGQADIYKGSYQGRCVCIKVMRVFETMDKQLVLKHFWKEAILWRQLSHPNILPVYGLYRFQDRPCLVAPWMKDGNISKYLKDNPQVLRLPLAVGVARGLNYLHCKNIIHGDLKGSNVLIDDLGTARVTDFGISSISDPEILTLTSHSGAASKGGTVRWQAPELIAMQDDFDIKNSKPSDAYAWACVCYEIFTGRIPLDHLPNDAAVMYHVAVKGVRPSPPPSSSPPWKSWGLTAEIWSIMKGCWRAEPSDRPTMNSVLNQLNTSALSSEPDTQFSPHYFRASMTKALSESKTMSTRVLDKLMLYNEPHAPTGSTSRGKKFQNSQGAVQRRVQSVSQIMSSPRPQDTALTLRSRFEVTKDPKRTGITLPLNLLQSSSIHLLNDEKKRYSDQGATLTNMGHLITRLGAIFDDDTQFKKLLECQGTKAQKLLDAFQTIIDISGITSDFRQNIIIAAQELSKRSGLVPRCYIIENIEMEIPALVAKEFPPRYHKCNFMGRTVGLKPLRFHNNIKNGSHVKEIFTDLFILWSQLSHTNLLPVFGLHYSQSYVHVVSPWMENGTMVQFLTICPPENHTLLLHDVATGIAYLHDNDIVHGEVKGTNIYVDECARARLAHFGFESTIITDESLTSIKSMSRWQAPELLRITEASRRPETKASDIYAFACVAYEIFTHNSPFHDIDDDSSVISQVLSGEHLPQPDHFDNAWTVRGLTEDIWALMESCWSFEQSHRPKIHEVLSSLHSEIVVDERPMDLVLTPSCFRDLVYGKRELPSLVDIDIMLLSSS